MGALRFRYDDHIPQVREVPLDLRDHGDKLLGDDEHARVAVVEIVFIIVGSKHRVDGNGHRAYLDRAPEDRVELRHVEHQHKDAVVDANA